MAKRKVVTEAEFKRLTTEHHPPAAPPFSVRAADRDRREIEGDIFAGLTTDDPVARRARMLASRLSLIAERLEDIETPEEELSALQDDVDRAWCGLTNVLSETGRRLLLEECIETHAIDFDGQSIDERLVDIRRSVARCYPDFAAKLDSGKLRLVLEAWSPRRGPDRRTRRAKTQRRQTKWKLLTDLLRAAGEKPPVADSLKHEWKDHRPKWLGSMKSRLE